MAYLCYFFLLTSKSFKLVPFAGDWQASNINLQGVLKELFLNTFLQGMKFCTRCSWSISCMPSGRLLTKSRCSRCCSIFSERNISSIFFSLLLIFFSCWLDNLNTLSLFGDNLINGSCISGRCATALCLVVLNWSDWFIRPHSTSSLKLIISSSSWFLQTWNFCTQCRYIRLCSQQLLLDWWLFHVLLYVNV